jgi:regulator of protease activity HflC (stomatin/prohibitin superfamily)
MTFIFFVALIIAVIGLIVAVAGEGGTRVGGAIVMVVFAFIALSMCFTTVDARAVAVQTSMGRYKDTLGPGFSWTAPWSSTEEWTTRLQTSHFAGNGKDDDERDNYHAESCVAVKLYAEQRGCVDATVEWAVTEASIKTLWDAYKDFDTARKNYVNTEIRAQIAAAFEGYDPLLKLRDPNADKGRGTYEQFSVITEGTLRPLFEKRGLALKAVRVTNIDYPDSVDKLLNAMGVSVANTKLAEQDVETAKQQAEAARQRNNPDKVVAGCEALIRDLAAQDKLKDLPQYWQCPGQPGPAIVAGGR